MRTVGVALLRLLSLVNAKGKEKRGGSLVRAGLEGADGRYGTIETIELGER